MYVEDRASYNGPIQVSVRTNFTVADLKEQVQNEFEIPVGVQRWILGKSLAEDDSSTLASHNITQNGQTIYLYLVAPKIEDEDLPKNQNVIDNKADHNIPVTDNGNNHKRGRYWNYELDRWSYCSSDTDEEESRMDDNPEPVVNAVNDNKKDMADPVKEEKKQAPPGKTQRLDPRDGWECPTCTLQNEPTRPGCEACTTERPKDYQIPPPGPADTLPRGATALTAPVPTKANADDHEENPVKEVKAATLPKDKVPYSNHCHHSRT